MEEKSLSLRENCYLKIIQSGVEKSLERDEDRMGVERPHVSNWVCGCLSQAQINQSNRLSNLESVSATIIRPYPVN